MGSPSTEGVVAAGLASRGLGVRRQEGPSRRYSLRGAASSPGEGGRLSQWLRRWGCTRGRMAGVEHARAMGERRGRRVEAGEVEMTLAESVVRSRACAVHSVVIRFRGTPTPTTVSLSRLAPGPPTQSPALSPAQQSIPLIPHHHMPCTSLEHGAAVCDAYCPPIARHLRALGVGRPSSVASLMERESRPKPINMYSVACARRQRQT